MDDRVRKVWSSANGDKSNHEEHEISKVRTAREAVASTD